ncbi:MAG: adenylate/guanylate cyclase domain-containing protein [Bacteroidota bacterium]
MLETRKRQLAAIMFTDMVGYTALMQKDEARAKENRDRHRSILRSTTKKYQGQILQYFGDGTMIVFNSSIQATKCAIEIQRNLREEPSIPLRIGLHSGDVVYDNEGIYGDGVNIASRIESISVPGAVLISEKVYDDLKSHVEFQTAPMGRFELKNVDKPVEVYAIDNDCLAVPHKRQLKGKKVDQVNSIAVLPFVNMSSNPDNEYFSDGISEELLNALTRVDGLMVTSRTSSFAFKNRNEDVRQIGRQLGVNTVLEGSVRRAGNKVRITAQLIDTYDGFHIWSEVFDRSLDDIFEVQDEISSIIANKLRAALSTDNTASETVTTSRTENMEAYNYYLKGVYHYNKWMPVEVKASIEHFKTAIALEPDFVLAHVGASYGYSYLSVTGQIPPKTGYPEALVYAEKALELAPEHEGGHIAQSMISLFYDFDWDKAKACLEKALEINPDKADALHYYSLYQCAIGDVDGAFESVKKAIKVDPLSLPINKSMGDAYLFSGKYENAIAQYDRTLSLDPEFRGAIESKGWVYIVLGDYQKAIEVFQAYHDKVGHELKGITGLGYAYAMADRWDEARDILDRMHRRMEVDEVINLDMDFAVLYMGMGETDKAYQYLEKGLINKIGGIYIMIHPLWEEVRKDDRFKRLIDKYHK